MNRAPDVTGEMIYELTVKLAQIHHEMFSQVMEANFYLRNTRNLENAVIDEVISAVYAEQKKLLEMWLSENHLRILRNADDLEDHFLPALITSG